MSDPIEQFDTRIRENQADLLRYFLRRIDNPADAAEAYGELLVNAWRLRRRLPESPDEARPWLFAVARNVMRNARRTAARRIAAVVLLADDLATLPEPMSAHDDVREAIASLPEDDAELLRLTYWDGLRSHEAAVVLGVSASAVRSRLAKARETLRSLLESASVR